MLLTQNPGTFTAGVVTAFSPALTQLAGKVSAGDAGKQYIVRSSAFLRSSSQAGRLEAELQTIKRPFLATQKCLTAPDNSADR